LGEDGLDKGEPAWVRTGEDVDCGADEEFEGDHGGDGVAGEAEDGLALAESKDYGLAGTDGYGVKDGFGLEFFEDGFDQVVFSCGDAAGEDERVGLESSGNFLAEIIVNVFGVAEKNRFGVKRGGLRGEGDGVGVADLEGTGNGSVVDDFVAGGKDGDARLAENDHLGCADLSGSGDLSETEARAFCEYSFVGGLFAALRDHMLAGLDGAIESDGVGVALRVLDHDDGVGARREGRTGHDLDTGAGWDGGRGSVAGFEFADAMECCAGMSIGSADRVAVADRAVEGRVVAVGENVFGEDAALGGEDWDGLGSRFAHKCSEARDYHFTSLLVGEHRVKSLAENSR